jgi:four helix bundle protein
MTITTFRQLGVWQKAHQLRLAVFDLADTLPRDQGFVVPDQIRRAAHSIASNIAEGFGRRHFPGKVRFYNISEGSAEELKDALILLRDRRHPFDFQGLWDELEEVCRMLKGLIRATEEWSGRSKQQAARSNSTHGEEEQAT